jgi:hypothetical protein
MKTKSKKVAKKVTKKLKIKSNPKKSERKSAAYKKGYDAFFSHNNPYRYNTQNYRDYKEGADDARKE